MTASEWSRGLTLRDRAYGVRHRVRRFRWEMATGGRPLVRWFPRSWFTDPLAMVDICSPWEVAWVTRHMATSHRGVGAIVELGPWLGDITIGMLRGLDRNPAGRGATIDVYDLFVFEDIEQRAAGMPLEGRMRDGESFLELFVERLGSSASRVVPHAGDVLQQSWPADRHIEFLFNDVAKTWQIWNHVKSTFYRSLGPGATVVEQDWAHACTPWLHLWHHRHRDHFDVLGQVPNAGSVAFRLVAPLPRRRSSTTSWTTTRRPTSRRRSTGPPRSSIRRGRPTSEPPTYSSTRSTATWIERAGSASASWPSPGSTVSS